MRKSPVEGDSIMAGGTSRLWRRRGATLWVLAVVLAGSCLVRYWSHRHNIRQFTVREDVLGESLAEKVNPNTDSWASLARLPGIGPARARAIVTYREDYRQAHGAQSVAFAGAEDLERVKGIGAVTVEQIRQFLILDEP